MTDYVRQHTLGSLVRSSFQIPRRHVGVLAIASLIPAGIVLAIHGIFRRTPEPSIGGMLVDTCVGFLNVVPMTVLVSDICVGNKPGLQRAYRRGIGKTAGRTLLASFVSLLVIAVGYVLLIVPGIIFTFWYWFVSVVSVLEGTAVRASLRRSRQLGQGFYLRNAGIFLFMLLLVMTPGMLIGAILGGGVGILAVRLGATTAGPWAAHVVGQLLAAVVVLPLYVTLVLLYYDMRVRKEAYDSTRLAEDLKS